MDTLKLASGAALALTLACGGSSSSSSAAPAGAPPALKLAYTDPAPGDIGVVRDAALSTDSHLVLDIVGNSPSLGAGIVLGLSVEPSVATWAKVQPGDAEFVQNGTVFDLGSGVRILRTKLSGGNLQLAVSQKSYATAVPMTGVLARVALDLQPGTSAGAVSFSALPIGNQMLSSTGAALAITPAVGGLSVQ
jgi:hypothetical protein